ncbi:hypothetical protein Dimus_017836 [Dionaea muscipula]
MDRPGVYINKWQVPTNSNPQKGVIWEWARKLSSIFSSSFTLLDFGLPSSCITPRVICHPMITTALALHYYLRICVGLDWDFCLSGIVDANCLFKLLNHRSLLLA